MVRYPKDDPSRAVYGISVAADLVGNVPQNLRLYEARGLVSPTRSEGGTRRYSENDLDRLRDIGRLLEAGLNLAGVDMVNNLEAANRLLRQQLGAATPGASQRTHSTSPERDRNPSKGHGGDSSRSSDALTQSDEGADG